MQSKGKKLDKITREQFENFITTNVNKDPFKLSFRLHDADVPHKRFFLEQLKIYQKAIHKLPTYVDKFCLFSSRSYEQASSEATARYKASLIKGKRVLDICAGLGVDDWAFAAVFEQVVSVDKDEELNEIARYNFELLGCGDIVKRYAAEAGAFLAADDGVFDWIYADADRRDNMGRVHSIRDSEPDVLGLLPRLLASAKHVLLKLSPMADITECCRLLKKVDRVEVLSVENEVKELLFFLSSANQGEEPPEIKATDIDRKGNFKQWRAEKAETEDRTYTEEGAFFYEPALAVVKAGLTASLAGHYHLHQLDKHSVYMLGLQPAEGFMGRSFSIVKRIPFSEKSVRAYLQEAQISKANIARRNFPLDSAALKAKLKLRDGGEDYLFFSRAFSGRLWMFHCRKI